MELRPDRFVEATVIIWSSSVMLEILEVNLLSEPTVGVPTYVPSSSTTATLAVLSVVPEMVIPVSLDQILSADEDTLNVSTVIAVLNILEAVALFIS